MWRISEKRICDVSTDGKNASNDSWMLQQAKQKENGCVSINLEKAHGEIANKNTAHGGGLTFYFNIYSSDHIYWYY